MEVIQLDLKRRYVTLFCTESELFSSRLSFSGFTDSMQRWIFFLPLLTSWLRRWYSSIQPGSSTHESSGWFSSCLFDDFTACKFYLSFCCCCCFKIFFKDNAASTRKCKTTLSQFEMILFITLSCYQTFSWKIHYCPALTLVCEWQSCSWSTFSEFWNRAY